MGQPRSQPSCDRGQAKSLMKLPVLPNEVERVVASFGKPEGLSLNNEKPEQGSSRATTFSRGYVARQEKPVRSALLVQLTPWLCIE